MNDQQPPSWFTTQEPNPDDPELEQRKKQLLEEMPKLLARQRDRGRAQSFYPYLLVRSVLGDRGDRPIGVPFWESPDIWTAAGEPSTSPAVPPDHGGTVTAGQPNTVYAHVWNLGFAPLAGILVEFYWFNPSLAIDGSHANLIGQARCELAARGMQGSHALVKCPTPWVPVMENGGHECLVVRVSGIGDPLGANSWQPWLNRHVAQRNVSVVSSADSLTQLSSVLTAATPIHRLQLIQVGPTEGEVAARIVAPTMVVSPAVTTHLLGELKAEQEVTLEHPAMVMSGLLAPVHSLSAGPVPAAPVMRAPGEVPIFNPTSLVKPAAPVPEPPPAAPEPSLGSRVAELLTSVERLQPGAPTIGQPTAGQVHVLRLANYDSGGQLIGGYTIVVPGG